jgi:hemerythrin superfamily protein
MISKAEGVNMTFTIPSPLKLEHEELHADLAKAAKAGGRIGDAATAVAKVLHDHFLKEEEFALPPLGLLSLLSRDKVEPGMETVLAMTDRLKKELPEMLREHEAVVAALQNLIAAAKEEQKLEHAHFAEKLMLHAKTEEQVLYPAAILIGEYLKLKLKNQHTSSAG